MLQVHRMRLTVGLCRLHGVGHMSPHTHPPISGRILVVEPQRGMKNLIQPPAFFMPFVSYASNCFPTEVFQTYIEGLQSMGASPICAYIMLGASLRLLCLPLHVYSEKLLSRRIQVSTLITENIQKKLGQHYNIPIVVDPETGRNRLDTNEEKIYRHFRELAFRKRTEYVAEHKLQLPRIMCLRLCTAPLWIMSSFAISNILSGGLTPVLTSFLWLGKLTEPDPYYIFPVATGILGFLSIYSQRFGPMKYKRFYEGAQVVLVVSGISIMSMVPACISIYWFTVLGAGLLQTQLLRLPRVKQLLGIGPLPTDSPTPFRDLFLLRRTDMTSELNIDLDKNAAAVPKK